MTKMPVDVDVAVVGGGPAGAVVAVCLARLGWRIALLEATSFDGERYGETLPPEINPVLRELGLWDYFQAISPLHSPGIISAWGQSAPNETDFIRNPHGLGWHIDRNRFDEMLCNEARRVGAQVFTNARVTTCARKSGGWEVAGISATTLVDASGRNGLRIDGECRREKEDMLLAIALRIGYPGSAACDMRTCIESTPSGWWYTSPLPGGDGMAMFFTDTRVYANEGISIAEQLAHAPLTACRLHNGRIMNSRVVHAPSARRVQMAGEDWIAVGDSASSYDPLSGRGIFKALRQGVYAATAVHDRLSGDRLALARYAARVGQEFDIYVKQRRLYYATEQRWIGHSFWSSRHEQPASNALRPVSLVEPFQPAPSAFLAHLQLREES
jgi:flavin-dependent dehydrogenase